MDRQTIIEAIYDTMEFPHCEYSSYSDIYYSFAHAMNMEISDMKEFFPQFPDPATDVYKIRSPSFDITSTTAYILENTRLDILESMLGHMEHTAEVAENDPGYDSF